MAFFGLFGKKKESAISLGDMPKPPTPPSSLKLPEPGKEPGIEAPQHVDDLGPGLGGPNDTGTGIGQSLDLPELEFPKLDMPSTEEEEIKTAIEEKSKSELSQSQQLKSYQKKLEVPSELPADLPEIGEAEEPKSPASDVQLVQIDEPIELRPTPSVRGPVFIRADRFKDVKNSLSGLRDTLNKSEETLNNLNELKNRLDSDYEAWHSAAESIQRKLLYIDNMLFE